MEYPIPILLLPNKLRPILSCPQGKLFVSRGLIHGIKTDYAVGDVVSLTMEYSVNVIDYKTRRREEYRPPINKPSIHIVNPRGSLSINTITMFKAGGYKTYIVHGEEDLVPLAISLERDSVSIGYGQPGVGVVVLESSILRARRLLKTFKPALYLFNKA